MKGRGSPSVLGREKGGAFFLYGDDAFRKEEVGRSLVEAHLDPGTRDFNFDPLRGSEVDAEGLASVLATPPMMAEWRVVFLREVEALAPSPRAREALLEVAKKPPPGLALIMLASIPGGSKARFYSELIRASRSMEFHEIGANDVPGWLLDRAASRHGVQMKEDAARALAAAVGTDLGVLSQEVEKLASLVGDGGTITLDSVKAAGTHIPTQDPWKWMDLVGNREFEKALAALPVLFGQGETGVLLVMGLSTHLLRLGLLRSAGERALDESLPARQRGWLTGKLAQQAYRWPAIELQDALHGLKRVDRILKSSSLLGDQLLEEWLLARMMEDSSGMD